MQLEAFQRQILADHFAGARELLVICPKKQGKSTLLSALALYSLLTTDDAEVVIAAASRDQAMILYDAAVGFIRRNDWLSGQLKAQGGYRQIRSLSDGGRIRVLAADVDTADGVRPTLALVDELHRHKSAALYGVFRDGLGPRHGQMVTISTAGDRETSPLGVMRAAARQLPDRRQHGGHLRAVSSDRSFVLHEWALQEGDDPDRMSDVKKANPASWWTIPELQKAHDSPTMLAAQWARYRCGIWASAQVWWLDPETWKAAATEDRLRDGDRITLGFDGARVHDATALIACRIDDGLLQPLKVWEDPRDGTSWEVPGGEVDAAVDDAFSRFQVARMYADPPLWYTELDQWAQAYGSGVMKFPTGRSRMFDAVERFRTDLTAGRLRHTGDETLTRHALNAQVSERRNGYWLVKPGAGLGDKIDAAVASVLAWEARAHAATANDRPAGELVTF